MSELGQLLRKARLEKGISLEDMQETTKIRKRYLEAIEDGNYKLLPGNFYVRAFIKSYSESVGLDPNEVLRLYRNVIPVSEVDSKVEPNHRKRSGIKTNDRWSKRITTLVFITFLVLIIVLVYYFADKNSKITDNTYKTDEQNQRLTKKEVDVVEPNATPVATIIPNTPTPQVFVLNSPAEVKLVSSVNGVDYYTISNVKQIELQISVASDDCWYEIDEVSGLSSKKLIETGTIKTTNGAKKWTLERPVYVKLGRANAAEVKVNGALIPVGDLPNVRKFQFELV
ncbi:MAG: RodZ domain-containing protein [Paenibacillaceae bacterium]